jgi:hypothetical protein
MNIELDSDWYLATQRNYLERFVETATQEEIESGEVNDWAARLKLVDAEIKHRHEQGAETR